MVSAVEALADNPRPPGVVKLSGSERTYRIRIGEYRVIYEILSVGHVVEVERVRHRKDAYRK